MIINKKLLKKKKTKILMILLFSLTLFIEEIVKKKNVHPMLISTKLGQVKSRVQTFTDAFNDCDASNSKNINSKYTSLKNEKNHVNDSE